MKTHIVLICPACGYEWHAATIDSRYDEIAKEAIAKQCYCPLCQQAPPMKGVFIGGEQSRSASPTPIAQTPPD